MAYHLICVINWHHLQLVQRKEISLQIAQLRVGASVNFSTQTLLIQFYPFKRDRVVVVWFNIYIPDKHSENAQGMNTQLVLDTI